MIINTTPKGRSPKGKFFFGKGTELLDKTRPKENQIGEDEHFTTIFNIYQQLTYSHTKLFTAGGLNFVLHTDSEVHAQFADNMFQNLFDYDYDWTIIHSTKLKLTEPQILINLDRKMVLIGGTSFLGEIKKSVFSILGYELPQHDVLPMHCSAFEYNDETSLMFGLSGTGKTTLSSDPDFHLIGDDEISWHSHGIQNIETGCYAKTEGLDPVMHKTIYDAMKKADELGVLIEENTTSPNARSSYPTSVIEGAIINRNHFKHPKNIFFLAMDATGTLPAISDITCDHDTVKLLFNTGYTSKMPGTEEGVTEITKTFSPCYGSPFMPLAVSTYSDMLIKYIEKHNCNVFLLNTGMGSDGNRFKLDLSRKSIKHVLDYDYSTVRMPGDDILKLDAITGFNEYISDDVLPQDWDSDEYKNKLIDLGIELSQKDIVRD